MLERFHHGKDHIFVVVLFDPCEIEIGGEPPTAPDKHLAQAGAALECEFVQNTVFGHQLER